MVYQYHTLNNGIRIIHRYVDKLVAHCGIIINAGSRDETGQEHGLAHFIEHVIFKGTKNRRAFQILSRMENVGGELDTFTTKEDTCIYASFLNRYYERAIELFYDILVNSTFLEKEINKEKDVVMQEIESYKDSPSEQIFDDFEEMIFSGHPLSRNVLGKPEYIKKFNTRTIKNFIKNNYHTDGIVICSVGKIDFSTLISIAERYFSGIPCNKIKKQRVPFENYIPKQKMLKKDTHQMQCIIGNIAYNSTDDRRYPLILLNNILGGPGMNSRLNMTVREDHGLCYNIESNYVSFCDTGIFSVYFATDAGQFEKTNLLIRKELKKFREQKLGTLQLSRAKQQLMGQLAISYESYVSEMLYMGKSIIVEDKVDTMQELNRKIESITANAVSDIANEIFCEKKLSMLTYKPNMQ